MYKRAIRYGYRYQTTKGLLTTEQLWQLSLTELDALAVNLDEKVTKVSKKSFLNSTSKKDEVDKDMFDIVIDIINTKIEERDAAKLAKDSKEHNQKIMSLIAEKEEGALKEKSIEELKSMLK